jgi:hypothetical protein
MPDPNDFTEAGEIFRKSMQEALDHLDSIADDVRVLQEKVIDDQLAAKYELQRIEREAEQISKDYVDKHRKQIESEIRDKVLFEISKNMIRDGRLAKEIYTWLQIPQKMLADAWMELGFEPLNGHVANVGYEDQGRSGNVIFYREDKVLRFEYEFGGGDTLAIVYIPTEENWISNTGLPLEDRMPILEFTAQRIIRDQAQGYQYVINPDTIIIKH